MNRIYQTIQNNGGQNGDCFRCCIASILELPARNVPHFYQNVANGGYTTPEEDRRVVAWFQALHMSYFETGYKQNFYSMMQFMGDLTPDLTYVLSGGTADHFAHSVVCRGNQIIHNPASETIADPLPRPCADGYYRVGIIVRNL